MRLRIWLLILPLMLAALACGLTTSEDNAPTDAPTVQVGLQTSPIATVASATPRSTATTAPTLFPTPNCSLRTDWPTVTVQSGETLFTIAQRAGTTIDALTQANCLSDPNAIRAGQVLYVPVAVPPTVTPVGSTTGGSTTTGSGTSGGSCTGTWFFSFNSTVSETRCPSTVVISNAAGEDFEGGRAIWYEASGIFNARVIYVVFNDGGWSVYGDTWDPSQPYNDSSIVPPSGRYQPVAGIGKLWRTQPGLRDKLGWAYEPEKAFTGRRQEPIFPSNSSVYDLYLDMGARNVVVRLREQLVEPRTQSWIVAGTY